MSQVFLFPTETALDTAGESIANAKLWFFEAGTSTPQAVYADNALTIPLTNPVVADGSGRFTRIYMQDDDYKVALTDADAIDISSPIWVYDNVNGLESSPIGGWGALSYIRRNAANTGWDSLLADQVWDDVKESATETNEGVAEIATQAETDAGVSDTTIVTPLKLKTSIASSSATPLGYQSGMVVSNNVGDANHDFDIASGVVKSSDGTTNITNSSTMTKQDDANWAAGTNAGAMPAKVAKTGTITSVGTAVTGIGTLFTTEFQVGDVLWSNSKNEGRGIVTITDANNIVIESAFTTDILVAETPRINGLAPNWWYDIYALSGPTGVADFGLDTRIDASLLLADTAVVSAGLTKRAYIMSIRTDASTNILPFFQRRSGGLNEVIWNVLIQDVNDLVHSSTASLHQLTVPSRREVQAKIHAFCQQVAATERYGLVTYPGQTDTAPTADLFNLVSDGDGAARTREQGFSGYQLTNTNRQIRIRWSANVASGTTDVFTAGWLVPIEN